MKNKTRDRAVKNVTLKPKDAFVNLCNGLLIEGGILGPTVQRNFARTIHRDKKSSFGFPNVPKDFAEFQVEVPQEAQVDQRREVLLRLLCRCHRQPRLAQDAALYVRARHHRMSSVNIWLLNGTFKSCPKPFKQVCTSIRVSFGSVCRTRTGFVEILLL